MELNARRKQDGSNSRSQRPTYHRFLMAMSVYKILQCIWAAGGPMPVPIWTEGYGTFGNTGTCTAQGFFTTLSLSELIYNAGLSVYYILTIRYGFREQWISRRYEPVVHAVAFIEPMIFGISALSMTIYNPSFIPELGCWASPFPLTCYFAHETCERGRYFTQWSWAFYSQQCLYVTIIVIMSGLLYWTIRSQYVTSNRYASRESVQMRERTRDVAYQALLFSAVAIFTTMWSIITTLDYLWNASPVWTKISVFTGVPAFTSQGFFNFLVYIRPRYIRVRRRKPEIGRWGALVEVVCGDPKNNRRPLGSFSSEDGSRWTNMFRRRSSSTNLKLPTRTSVSGLGASSNLDDGVDGQSCEPAECPIEDGSDPENKESTTSKPSEVEKVPSASYSVVTKDTEDDDNSLN